MHGRYLVNYITDEKLMTSISIETDEQPEAKLNWRYYLGAFLFIVANLLWLIALIVLPLLGLSQPLTTILFGLSIAGGPDLLTLAAVAIMGKENLVYLMGRIGGVFKRTMRWDNVSQRRYRLGLLLWIGSAVVTLGLFYFFPGSFRDGNQPGWGFYVTIAADVVFIFSIFVMGAPFWTKFAALFHYDA